MCCIISDTTYIQMICVSVVLVVQVCKEVQTSHGKLLKDWIKGIQGESLDLHCHCHA